MEHFNNYTLTQELGSRDDYFYFISSNAKNETMLLEISHCENYGKKSLPYMWLKGGYTDREINKYLICRTYVEAPDKPMLEKYNPQLTKDFKINFKWLLEDTEENEQALIDEVARQFYAEAEK